MTPDQSDRDHQAGLPRVLEDDAVLVAVVSGDTLSWANDGFERLTGVAAGRPVGELIARTAPWARAALATRVAAGGEPRWTGRFGGCRSDGLPWLADLGGTTSPPPAGGASTMVLTGVRVGGPLAWAADPGGGDSHLGLDSMLSHDVRAALRHAGGFAGVVARTLAGAHDQGALPDSLSSVPERLETALRAVALADEMVAAAVRLMRVEAEPWVIEAFSLDQLLDQAMILVRERLAGSVPDVVADLPGSARLVGARERLSEVVAELVVNSAKFGGSNAVVTVAATPIDDSWIRLSVIDDGPGIADEFAEDAFSPGRMLQPRGQFPGVGMGLTLVRTVVARHGGRAVIDGTGPRSKASVSPPGGGARVTFELPTRAAGSGQ